MKYDISKSSAPKMPKLGKGTECVKILLSQVSKDMYEPLVPMLFPILGAHVSGSEFQYPDNDTPGERLFLQLKEVLPSLVRHQLPVGCKDYSEYYSTFAS